MNIYEKIGLQKVINASGKMTILGVSTLSDVSVEAFKEGSQNFVVMSDLMDKAGEIISGYTGAESTCVTSSASAGIVISVASLIAKNTLVNIENIDTLKTEKKEIIIQKGHVINYGTPIKTMIEMGSGKLIEVGQSNQTLVEHVVENITESTVGLFYVKSHHCVQKGMLSLEKMIEIAKKYNLPLIVDAAAEEDLKRYIKLGADMVIYSGSKAIEAPASGFITGKKEFIENCKAQYKGIGRAMKVDKGIIMGLLASLQEYSRRNETDINKENKLKAELLSEKLQKLTQIESKVVKDEAGREIYRTEIQLKTTNITAEEVIKKLVSGNPAIYTRNYYKNQGKIHFDLRAVQKEDLIKIVKKIQAILN